MCVYTVNFFFFLLLRGINKREVTIITGEEKSFRRRWLPGSHSSPYKEIRGRKEDEISLFPLSGDFKTRGGRFLNRIVCFCCNGLESKPWVPEWQLDFCLLLIEGQKSLQPLFYLQRHKWFCADRFCLYFAVTVWNWFLSACSGSVPVYAGLHEPGSSRLLPTCYQTYSQSPKSPT